MDLCVVVTEIVSNAVRHAGLAPDDRLELAIDERPHTVRVEVVQPGPPFTIPRATSPMDAASGWGLLLVQRVASRWGIATNPTRVWVEIDH